MMQYGHRYAVFCLMIKLKVMFWKLYTRIYFNVGPFRSCFMDVLGVKLHLCCEAPPGECINVVSV